MEAGPGLEVGRDRLVAVEAECAFGIPFEGTVAAATLGLHVSVSGDHRTRRDETLEIDGKARYRDEENGRRRQRHHSERFSTP